MMAGASGTVRWWGMIWQRRASRVLVGGMGINLKLKGSITEI